MRTFLCISLGNALFGIAQVSLQRTHYHQVQHEPMSIPHSILCYPLCVMFIPPTTNLDPLLHSCSPLTLPLCLLLLSPPFHLSPFVAPQISSFATVLVVFATGFLHFPRSVCILASGAAIFSVLFALGFSLAVAVVEHRASVKAGGWRGRQAAR